MIDDFEPLSPEGLRRREEILLLAKHDVRRRRRRVLVVRGACAVIGVIATGLWLHHPLSIPRENRPQIAVRHQPTTQPPTSAVQIVFIETDPAAVSRLFIRDEKPKWQRLGDDALLQSLADAGTQAGLVSVNGREMLVTR